MYNSRFLVSVLGISVLLVFMSQATVSSRAQFVYDESGMIGSYAEELNSVLQQFNAQTMKYDTEASPEDKRGIEIIFYTSETPFTPEEAVELFDSYGLHDHPLAEYNILILLGDVEVDNEYKKIAIVHDEGCVLDDNTIFNLMMRDYVKNIHSYLRNREAGYGFSGFKDSLHKLEADLRSALVKKLIKDEIEPHVCEIKEPAVNEEPVKEPKIVPKRKFMGIIGEDASCEAIVKPGPKHSNLCGGGVGNGKFFTTLSSNTIQLCHPVIIDWIKDNVFWDTDIKEELRWGIYDNVAKEAFNQLDKQLPGTKCYSGYGYTPNTNCETTPVYKLLDDDVCGRCSEVSGLLFSTLRTMGIPADRVYHSTYDVDYGGGLLKQKFPTGHGVTFYKSDNGEWWMMDLHCCHAIVPESKADKWESICGTCNCEGRKQNYGNDYKIADWTDPDLFGKFCSDVEFATATCNYGEPVGSCIKGFPNFLCSYNNNYIQDCRGADKKLDSQDLLRLPQERFIGGSLLEKPPYFFGDCGCPSGTTCDADTGDCVCEPRNSCIGNGIYCNGYGQVVYWCGGPDKIPRTKDDCGCPTGSAAGSVCQTGGWCK